jgi:DNA invertase Pin-like site-specific DNA recombinase
MGILALIAEFENDIRRERQMDGIAKANERGVSFGRKRELTTERVHEIKALRKGGALHLADHATYRPQQGQYRAYGLKTRGR